MAFKNAWRWSKMGGTASQQNADEIDSDGVWVAEESDLRSDIPTLITFVKGSGADPVGASVAAGLKVNDTIATPEAIAGASLTPKRPLLNSPGIAALLGILRKDDV